MIQQNMNRIYSEMVKSNDLDEFAKNLCAIDQIIDKYGNTLLHMAVKRNNKKMILVLRDYIPVNTQNDFNDTPVSLANNDIELLEILNFDEKHNNTSKNYGDDLDQENKLLKEIIKSHVANTINLEKRNNKYKEEENNFKEIIFEQQKKIISLKRKRTLDSDTKVAKKSKTINEPRGDVNILDLEKFETIWNYKTCGNDRLKFYYYIKNGDGFIKRGWERLLNFKKFSNDFPDFLTAVWKHTDVSINMRKIIEKWFLNNTKKFKWKKWEVSELLLAVNKNWNGYMINWKNIMNDFSYTLGLRRNVSSVRNKFQMLKLDNSVIMKNKKWMVNN